jgi:hypothetical protein
MNTSDLIPFDYSVVSSDTAVRLQAQAERIKTRIKKTTEDIIEIGKDLLAVKQQRLDHGQFRAWVEREVGINPRSAQMYMAAARLFEKNEIISRLLPTTVYRLAAPSTPTGDHRNRHRQGRLGRGRARHHGQEDDRGREAQDQGGAGQ